MGEHGFSPNEQTQLLILAIDDSIKTAREHHKIFAFGAGIALEMEAGYNRGDSNFTRNHADIDIHPYEEDIPFWRMYFEEKDYLISSNSGIKDSSKAFLAYSPDSKKHDDPEDGMFSIDVYGLLIDDKNGVHSRETGIDDPWNMTWDDAFIKVTWKGHEVWVMKHEIALRNKRETASAMGTPLREKDVHDHELFNVKVND